MSRTYTCDICNTDFDPDMQFVVNSAETNEFYAVAKNTRPIRNFITATCRIQDRYYVEFRIRYYVEPEIPDLDICERCFRDLVKNIAGFVRDDAATEEIRVIE